MRFLRVPAVSILALCGSLFFTPLATAEQTATNSAASELNALVSKVQDKLHQGKKTEAELAPELKEFDTLFERYKDQKTDDTAQIMFMKAMLYLEVFDDTKTGMTLVQQLKRDYPDTKVGKSADGILQNIQQQEEGKKVQQALAIGAKFPDFEAKDLDGKPLSPGNYKGKVLLVDFWATWCNPCVYELPNVIKAYTKYHDKGFEVIGISLDQEESRLKNFIKEKGMAWPQYFDGKGWENKIAQKYGIQSIPATFLLDGEGKIIAKNLRGEALDEQLGKSLPK